MQKRAVLWSGGADSTLVLLRELETNPGVGVIQFRTDWVENKWVDNLIVRHDLTVLTWLPQQRYFVEFPDRLALVDEYGYGDTFLPVVRDVVEGDKALETLEKRLTPRVTPLWDTLLTGWLHTDKDVYRQCSIGSTRLEAPIFDLTKEEVLRELKHRVGSLPDIETGDIALKPFTLPDSNLAYYQQRLSEQGFAL